MDTHIPYLVPNGQWKKKKKGKKSKQISVHMHRSFGYVWNDELQQSKTAQMASNGTCMQSATTVAEACSGSTSSPRVPLPAGAPTRSDDLPKEGGEGESGQIPEHKKTAQQEHTGSSPMRLGRKRASHSQCPLNIRFCLCLGLCLQPLYLYSPTRL